MNIGGKELVNNDVSYIEGEKEPKEQGNTGAEDGEWTIFSRSDIKYSHQVHYFVLRLARGSSLLSKSAFARRLMRLH